MTSVINLGYGPISANALAELEARGEIESYVEDGKIKYRRTGGTTPTARRTSTADISAILDTLGR